MPSKSPPSSLPSSADRPTPVRLNGLAILASVFLSLALVIGVFAWIVTHPNKPPYPSKATSTAPIASLGKTVAEPSVPPVPPPASVMEATLAFHRSPHRQAVVNNISLIEEDAPPLPPPAPPRGPGPAAVSTAPQPVGETYGTQVLFLNNQAAAADTARKDHKLLFVMHISGNFEDACFT
ncbi:MAG: hypothetical protein ACRELF_23935 [Gemmataceae bacterium]